MTWRTAPANWRTKDVRDKLPGILTAGMTQAEVARRIGCSEAAVCKAIQREQRGSPRRASRITEMLVPLLGTGMTQAEAARRIGCSRSGVCKALERLGTRMDGHRHRVTGANQRGASA